LRPGGCTATVEIVWVQTRAPCEAPHLKYGQLFGRTRCWETEFAPADCPTMKTFAAG
jgi:hypothetical protein